MTRNTDSRDLAAAGEAYHRGEPTMGPGDYDRLSAQVKAEDVQTVFITLDDGSRYEFIGSAAVYHGDMRRVTGVAFGTPKPLAKLAHEVAPSARRGFCPHRKYSREVSRYLTIHRCAECGEIMDVT